MPKNLVGKVVVNKRPTEGLLLRNIAENFDGIRVVEQRNDPGKS